MDNMVNKDYGTYTFKNKQYEIAVAKKLVDAKGNTLIAAPVALANNALYVITLDNPHDAKATDRKKIAIKKAAIPLKDIAEIKIVKLPPLVRSTLEGAAASLIDASKKKVTTRQHNKINKQSNVSITLEDPHGCPSTVDSAILPDWTADNFQKGVASALHKVLDKRIGATPVSNTSDYEVLSPYKISIRMTRPYKTSGPYELSGVVYMYCAIRIDKAEDYIGLTSFYDSIPLQFGTDEEKNMPIYKSAEDIAKCLTPVPKLINPWAWEKESTLEKEMAKALSGDSYVVMTNDDFKAMREDDNEFGELQKCLPTYGALFGACYGLYKKFDKPDTKEMSAWIKEMCVNIVKNNPEIFKTNK